MKRLGQNFLRLLAVAGLAVLATSCIQMQDQLTLNKDGSGSWKYKLVLNPQMTAMMAQAEAQADGVEMTADNDGMPPVDKQALEKMVAKVKGAKLTSFDSQVKNGSTYVLAVVEFSSIESVMASELGESIGWYFAKEGNELVATTKPLMSDDDDDDGDGGGNMQLGDEFNMAKSMMQGLRVNRRLSLPTPPTSHNAVGVKGNLAAWDFRIGPETTEEQFKKAGSVIPEYRTSAAGITFKLPLGAKPEAKKAVKEIDIDTKEIVADNVGLRPTHATLTRRLTYAKDEQTHFGGMPLQIQFKVPHPNPKELIGYTGPFIEKATDNLGTDLKPEKQGFGDPDDLRSIHVTSFNEEPKDFDLSIQLKNPDRTATSFSLSGHLFLHAPGETQTIELKDLGKNVGKQLPNKDDLWIKLESLKDHSIGLKFKGNWVASIQRVEAFDKNGKKLKQNGHSHSSFNNQAHHNYNYEDGLPDHIVISIATTVKKEKVPFSFTDLKLP